MCKICVNQPFPERSRTCLDSGSYLINFKGCGECGKREMIKIVKISADKTNGDDIEETISYHHVCGSCDHQIADHEYTFSVVDKEQEYSMNCLLCGIGQDTIAPFEPKS